VGFYLSETGGHEQVAPVALCEADSFVQLVEIALAELEDGEAEAVEVLGVELGGEQVVAALVTEKLAYLLALVRWKEERDALLGLGGERR